MSTNIKTHVDAIIVRERACPRRQVTKFGGCGWWLVNWRVRTLTEDGWTGWRRIPIKSSDELRAVLAVPEYATHYMLFPVAGSPTGDMVFTMPRFSDPERVLAEQSELTPQRVLTDEELLKMGVVP